MANLKYFMRRTNAKKIEFKDKVKPDFIRGILAVIRFRIFDIPFAVIKKKVKIRYTEL